MPWGCRCPQNCWKLGYGGRYGDGVSMQVQLHPMTLHANTMDMLGVARSLYGWAHSAAGRHAHKGARRGLVDERESLAARQDRQPLRVGLPLHAAHTCTLLSTRHHSAKALGRVLFFMRSA